MLFAVGVFSRCRLDATSNRRVGFLTPRGLCQLRFLSATSRGSLSRSNTSPTTRFHIFFLCNCMATTNAWWSVQLLNFRCVKFSEDWLVSKNILTQKIITRKIFISTISQFTECFIQLVFQLLANLGLCCFAIGLVSFSRARPCAYRAIPLHVLKTV